MAERIQGADVVPKSSVVTSLSDGGSLDKLALMQGPTEKNGETSPLVAGNRTILRISSKLRLAMDGAHRGRPWLGL